MKKILVIYTGGTLGMTEVNGQLTPTTGTVETYLTEHASIWPEAEISVVTFTPLIDSSDLSLAHINMLQTQLKESWSAYDAFVIVHGTDTMAYSAALLKASCTGTSKPIVYTGSQRPLNTEDSDAPANLSFALECAQTALNGIFLAFNHRLFPAGMFSKRDAQSFNAFEGRQLHLDEAISLSSPDTSPTFNTSPLTATPTIHYIHLFPGIDYHALPNAQSAHTVFIVRSYGSGNLPWENKDFQTFYRKNDHAIFISLSQCAEGVPESSAYASGTLKPNWIHTAGMKVEQLTALLITHYNTHQSSFDIEELKANLTVS